MDDLLYKKWRGLCAEFENAKREFDRSHNAMLLAVEQAHVDGHPINNMIQHFVSHDQAAERWANTRRELVTFCRDYPKICQSDMPGKPEVARGATDARL